MKLELEFETRYPSLLRVATILKIVGYLIWGVGAFVILRIIGSVIGMARDSSSGFDALYGIGVLLAVFLCGLTTFAFSELIRLFVDIEANTRREAH